MCGLAGFFDPAGFSDDSAMQTVTEMASRLIRRGPDDEGVWLDAGAGIALGHRRLKILDLSAAGRQPMTSASGRYVLVFNGEIYNHLQLRDKLSFRDCPPVWRGHSDTETLLATIDELGVSSALKESVGMFAIALWDRKERTLTLARDRMGEKPLYFGWQNGRFLFGSELSALRAHPEFRADIDRDVVALYMSRGYIEAPFSIFAGIFKLRPGTYLQVCAHDEIGSTPEPTTYWSFQDVAERGLRQPFDGDDNEAISELESRLHRSIELQSVADVPLGAFLSGGVDSSTIVAFLQAHISRPVKSFTIGFDQENYNEAIHASSVAKILGTDHTELYVTPDEVMEVIPSLPSVYDEPFGDSSAIPTLLISQLARQQVTVSLSGDGGDELFCGYKRYQRTIDIWNKSRRIPVMSRKAIARGLVVASRLGGQSELARKAVQFALYLSSRRVDECYQIHTVQRQNAHKLVLGAQNPEPQRGMQNFLKAEDGSWHGMMYSDALSYLPDDILAKVDRAAMFASLETRIPFLDHRVVEFAWTLPMHLKNRNGQGKWILKQILRKHIPNKLIDRPKMGFGVPVGEWLRGPLREWAEDLLSRNRLELAGVLDPGQVRQEWSRHLKSNSLSGDKIWQILMFQAWQSNDAHR